MAKAHVWHWFHSEDLEISGSNGTWKLAADGSLTGQLFQGPGFSNDKIVVNGVIRLPNGTAVDVRGAGNDVEFGAGSLVEASTAFSSLVGKNTVVNNGNLIVSSQGIDVRGDGSVVENGATGLISGSHGIITNGLHAKVINDGRILVDNDAISLRGAGSTFHNNGTIGSAMSGAFNCESAKSIVNGRHGEIYSVETTFSVLTHAGEHLKITNHGTIRTDGQLSILTGDGDETIVNDGHIIGGIGLGSGNDTIDLRGGHVTGPIIGGTGSDTLITDSAQISFEAEAAALPTDVDTIKSTVTYTLFNAVDDLALIGTSNTNGTGNEIDNGLTGNVGNNVLKGMDGADSLDGGKGNDLLVGGAGADTFGFATGYGKDEIKDFDRGEGDSIYVHHWKAIDNFSQIKRHAADHGAAVWITAGHDTLVIDHMNKADLHAGDFQF